MVQIVSRGNGLSSFLAVDTTDNTINIKQYREVGPNEKFNNDFMQSGLLTIDKSNPNEPQISSSGELDILDDEVALLHFDFESISILKGQFMHCATKTAWSQNIK